MVVLAVTISNKKGQVLISRQFVDMKKSRLESLINILPRLMSKSDGGSQHTFIETEDVRYLYHPMENLYLIILTTKASNIIEDLDTLKLFSRIIPEFCKFLTENGVNECAFDLIFAFDEVISFGYKEDVTMLQVKTITEMDSHDERVYLAMRQSQERDAKEKMKEKARELEMQRRLQMTTGMKPVISNFSKVVVVDTMESEILLSSRTMSSLRRSPSPRREERGRTLKLSKSKGPLHKIQNKLILDVEDELKVNTKKSPVHFRCEEKVSIQMSQERGLQSMDVSGLLYIILSDENTTRVQARIEHESDTPIQMQTHPHLDKNLFQSENLLAMKQIERSFPLNNDVYLLKWHLISTSNADLPLTLSCWPNKTPKGLEMTIEYQLNRKDLTLTNFWLAIPIGTMGQTEVTNYEGGDYSIDKRSPDGSIGRFLVWKIAVIDSTSDSGMIEFCIDGFSNKECFPINAGFTGSQSLCGIKIIEAINLDDSSRVTEFSCDTTLTCSKLQID